MKIYLKGAFVSLKTILLVDVVFVSFLAIILGIAKERVSFWLLFYSIFIFLLLLLPMLYTDFHRLAIKENRPQYDINPSPFNGFVYGLVSIIPFGILVFINFYVPLANEFYDRAKHLLLNTLVGPVYWVIKIGNESLISYVLALIVIVLITGLGYLAGTKGYYIKKSNIPVSKRKK